MKKVVDKHTVAHLWANKIQDDARTPTGNFYFRNAEIWSYGTHFLIAKHVENNRNHHAVLITKRNYSVTTSAQISIVRSASRHIKQIFVPDPDQNSETQFDKWFTEIKQVAEHLANARKPEKYMLQIGQLFGEAQEYANFFDLELPEYLVGASQIENFEQYREVISSENKLRAEREAKALKAKLIQQQKDLKLWRAFKVRTITTRDGFDYLRFNVDEHSVETSQRVFIPANIAQRFYTYILDTLAKGGCVNCDMRLMDRYSVSEINNDFIQVGCHKIHIKEIKSFTKKLGW
ncbi:hypothetical protein SAMN05216464_11377 [Mucilaginibacter pineti]|uniref:Uncharacterized protein n=1 Tax=Mucilaginibacter pineti TaxID=1391627 RepID=A0A1G7ILD3_9SPHI|nr:hypothetical protein [Mucilaginibacter pineti]SDF13537.1 hypothetical protein SAMN05216464_11377 [Mucilaginibacter pineti]